MALIDKIINLTISRVTTTLARAGFGVLLITGSSDKFPKVDSVTITFDAELVTGNEINWMYNNVAQSSISYSSSNNATMGALATAIQNLSTVSTAVASDVGAVGYFNTITVTGNADPARVLLSNFVVSGGASQAEVTLAYTPHTRIRYYSSTTEVAADFATTDPEYRAANAALGQKFKPTSIAIGQKRSGDSNWTEAFNAIANEDGAGWYAMIITSRTKADQIELAAWAEANEKLAGVASSDTGIIASTTSDIAATLQSSSYNRCWTFFHPTCDGTTNDTWPDAAWFGYCLPKTPGSLVWAYKQLSGIPAVSLTETEQVNLFGKNCNTVLVFGGQTMTISRDVMNAQKGGLVASGEWIDNMRFTDWLKVEIQGNIADLFVNSDKIPYTDSGLTLIEGRIRKALDQGIINGGIAVNTDEDKYGGLKYEVVIPQVKNVNFSDKAARKVKNITFQADFAGAAVHASIAGVLTA